MSRRISIAAALICTVGIGAGLAMGFCADRRKDREAMGQAVETAGQGQEIWAEVRTGRECV